MRKYLSYIIIFIVGLLIGATLLSVVFMKMLSRISSINNMRNVIRVRNIAHKVYKIGDFDSSITALNELVKELEPYQKTNKFIALDLGLTYARLFVVYERTGKQALANQNYQKAIELIGSRFKIKSPEELKGLIGKIDKRIRGTQYLIRPNENRGG